jgi:hypothetical protein
MKGSPKGSEMTDMRSNPICEGDQSAAAMATSGESLAKIELR